MAKRWLLLAVLALGVADAWPQGTDEGPVLSDLMQALQYAEMVQAAGFPRDQLSVLHELQMRWLKEQRASDETAGAVEAVCLQVAVGRSIDSALLSAGLGEEFRQAQERAQRATQSLAAELRDTLTPSQRQALLAFMSPQRGLGGLVDALRQVRKAPQPAWEQMRGDMIDALSGFGGPRLTPAVPRATVAEWLERVRQMPDADFEKAAPDLPGQWARALAPEMMRQVDDPGMRELRLLDVCRRLISDPGGRALVARLASGAGATAPPVPEVQGPGPAAR